MLKKLFLAVSVTAVAFGQSFHAFGQSPGELGPPPDTSPKISKWEIALDALPLIDKQSDAFGFLVRKYIGDTPRKALRFKLNPVYGNGLTFNGMEDFTIGTGLGLEWLKRYGKTTAYYGVEGDFTFRQFNLFSSLPGGTIVDIYPARVYTSAANFFVGGRYQIHPHWGVSVESFLRYQYIRGRSILPNGDESGHFDRALRVIPIRAIYLSYRF